MDINNLLQYLPEAIIAGFGGLFGWLTGRARRKAETETIKVDALKGMQEIYDKMVTDTNARLLEQTKRITELENIIYKLEKQIMADKKLIKQLQQKLNDNI